MSLLTIAGSKGGGSASFKQTADTLRSNDSFEIVLGLGEGRWKGLVNGQKSLFINDVPLESGDGTANFTDFTALFADGDPTQDQTVSFRLGAGGATHPVNVQLTNTNTTGQPGPWVSGQVTEVGMDYIDIRFLVQALSHQTDKGVFEATATLEIQLQPTGSASWVNPLIGTPATKYNAAGFSVAGIADPLRLYVPRAAYDSSGNWNGDSGNGLITITGKTTSAFVKELRVAIPNTGAWANKQWTIRARLIERDHYQADPVEDQRNITFESVTGISSKKYTWNGLAWLQLFGKASEQLSGNPTVKGIYDTMFVKAPPLSVYNPDTRTYTGATWDGSDNFVYTNDPAWCIRDLVEDNRSGISAFSPGTTLNRWDCLDASKWFSQQVPDGKGGTHPRYSLNVSLEEAQKASETLSYLAGAVGALTYEGGDGQLRMKVDKPDAPVAIFTNVNIVGGEFTYGNTDVDTRFNDIIGKFQNEDLNYQEDAVHLIDPDAIYTYGYRPTVIALVGCTNRQEALRRTKLRLRVLQNETKLVHFSTNRQGMMVEPLSAILIADADLANGTTATSLGRILSVTGSGGIVNLRDPVRLEVGVAYTLTATIPNPTYDPERTTQPVDADWTKPTITIQRTVINTSGQRGDVLTLFVDTPLPASLPEYAVFALDTPGLPSRPLLYRVTDVTPDDDNPELVTVSALTIDTGKWAASDNVDEAAEQALTLNPLIVPAPTAFPNTPVLTYSLSDGDLGKRTVLTAHWQRPGGLFVQGFQVVYRVNDGPAVVLFDRTSDTTAEIINPPPGRYQFEIRTIDRRGAMSLPLLSNTVDVDQLAAPTLAITAEPQVFIFLDQVAKPDTQTVILTAHRGSLGGVIEWSTNPSVPLVDYGDIQTMSLAAFGANRTVTVTASLSGVLAKIDVVRLDKSTADAFADVTSQHTALDTYNIGGRPTPVVLSAIDAAAAKQAQTELNLAQLDRDVQSFFGPTGAASIAIAKAEAEIVAARFEISAVNLAAQQAAADARAEGIKAQAQANEAREASLSALNVALHEASLRESDVVDVNYRISTTQAKLDDTIASVTEETLVRVDQVSALAYRATTVEASVGQNTASIHDEIIARTTATDALAGRSTLLETKVGQNTAAIHDEVVARTTVTDALAIRSTTLETKVGQNTSAITTEQTARSDADTALAQTITDLTASTSSNLTAAIHTEQLVRTNADTALGQRIDSLSATAGGASAAITAEALVRADADTALGQRIDTISASAGGANASITAEALVRANADSALASRSTVLESSFGDVSDTANYNSSFDMALRADGTIPGWYRVGYPGTASFTLNSASVFVSRGDKSAVLLGRDAVFSDPFPVTQSEALWLNARALVNAGRNGTQGASDLANITFGIRFYSTTGAQLYESYLIGGEYSNANQWQTATTPLNSPMITPAGAVKAQLVFYVDLSVPYDTDRFRSQIVVDYFYALRRPEGALQNAQALSTIARIATEETTRTTQNTATASKLSSVSAGLTTALLNSNSEFREWPGGTGTLPYGWSDWANGANPALAQKVYEGCYDGTVTGSNVSQGLVQRVNNISGGGDWIVEIDVTCMAGDFTGAGVLFRGLRADETINADIALGLATQLTTNQIAPGPGGVGATCRYRIFVHTPVDTNSIQIFLMNSWPSGLFGAATPKTLRWTRCGFRPASASETAAQRADVNANSALARISTEEIVSVQRDNALGSRIDSVNASIRADTNASVTNEATARANADGALAYQISTVSSRVDGNTATITNQQTSINGVIARVSVSIDVNGYVTGWEANNNGSSGDFTIRADRFRVGMPGTAGEFPFEVVGNVTYVKSLVVRDQSLGAVKLASGSTGQKSLRYDQTKTTFNSRTAWANQIYLTLTPALGNPVEGMFTFVVDSNGGTTAIYAQIVRDDGTVIVGAPGGIPLIVNQYGTPISLGFMDTVPAGRATTWTLQLKKYDNTTTMTCYEKFARCEESSRAAYQQFDYVPPSGGSGGGGPGGGGGGGGQIP